MTRRVVSDVLLATFFVATSTVHAADALRVADLAGTYVSGGCLLELRKDGSFSATCGSRQRIGRAIPSGRGLDVGGGRSVTEPPPAPAPPGIGSDWPPSLRDPTRGPYVARPEASELLEPLQWGARLYLIRSGSYESFCQAVRAGVEPRNTPAGDEFLRRGDHLKPVARKPPKECDDSK